MNDRIPGVMGLVIRELRKNPEISSAELYEVSARRYEAVQELSVRQFHARYPLQAKRQLNNPPVRLFPVPRAEPEPEARTADAPADTGARPGGEAFSPASVEAGKASALPAESAAALPEESSTPPLPRREALRLVLFRLAMDLETAESREEVVDVVAGVDRYVDEVMALGRA